MVEGIYRLLVGGGRLSRNVRLALLPKLKTEPGILDNSCFKDDLVAVSPFRSRSPPVEQITESFLYLFAESLQQRTLLLDARIV